MTAEEHLAEAERLLERAANSAVPEWTTAWAQLAQAHAAVAAAQQGRTSRGGYIRGGNYV